VSCGTICRARTSSVCTPARRCAAPSSSPQRTKWRGRGTAPLIPLACLQMASAHRHPGSRRELRGPDVRNGVTLPVAILTTASWVCRNCRQQACTPERAAPRGSPAETAPLRHIDISNISTANKTELDRGLYDRKIVKKAVGSVMFTENRCAGRGRESSVFSKEAQLKPERLKKNYV